MGDNLKLNPSFERFWREWGVIGGRGRLLSKGVLAPLCPSRLPYKLQFIKKASRREAFFIYILYSFQVMYFVFGKMAIFAEFEVSEADFADGDTGKL